MLFLGGLHRRGYQVCVTSILEYVILDDGGVYKLRPIDAADIIEPGFQPSIFRSRPLQHLQHMVPFVNPSFQTRLPQSFCCGELCSFPIRDDWIDLINHATTNSRTAKESREQGTPP
jgi:hypothetical protein